MCLKKEKKKTKTIIHNPGPEGAVVQWVKWVIFQPYQGRGRGDHGGVQERWRWLETTALKNELRSIDFIIRQFNFLAPVGHTK